MKNTFVLIWFCFVLGFYSSAQQIDERIETLLLQEEENTEGMAFKPIIGAGIGSFTFYGDITNYLANPINGLASARISISRNISKNFDIEFHGTFGSVSSNEYNGSSTDTMNFSTSLFLGGVSLYYNFNHILKRKRPIHPYFSLGAEIIQFTPKGDILDENNNPYNYWTDGTIRDVQEGIGLSGSIISRDFDYETDLRTLPQSKNGYYSKTAFAIPIDFGLNVTISDRVTCRIGATVHLAMTDYIDNYKGGNGFNNDIILNTYVSLNIDMFSPADEIASVENFKNLKFTITDRVDEDGDGVDDFNDECPKTPKGIKITYRGCPEDVDKDGVPDYIDKQLDTPSGAITGANGIRIMDNHLIVLLYDPDAVKRSEIKLYTKKQESRINGESKGIPEKFKPVDINEDNYISHDELQQAIDAIFEQNSTLTPDDIYELQEFFFNQ
ncbi:MAG: hypothetical protein JEZ09_03465 [Salinivirgaceae bacterium]|nr:hypothetical protein [Salinivirgaceae bacterium]